MRGGCRVSAYLTTVLSAGFIYAVLLLVAPVGEETQKTVRLVLSLAMLLLMLSPVFTGELEDGLEDLQNGLGNLENGEAGKEWLENEGRDAYLTGIRRAISEEFSVSEEDFSLTPVFKEGLSLASLTVTLSGKAVTADLLALERYGKENFCESFEVMLYLG